MRTVILPFYARLSLLLLAFVLIFFILSEASNIFIPLVFGLLIGILLYPLNNFFERRVKMGRGLAAATSVTLFIAALVGFVYFMTLQFIGFSDDMPLLRNRIQSMFKALQHWLSYKLHINNSQQTNYIDKVAGDALSSMAHSISNVFLSVTGILFFVIFILIYTFFILYHRKLLMRFVLHLFSVRYRERVKEVLLETKSMINSYVLGLVIEMLIISIVDCTLLLVLGVPYAILLGIMSAVLNIVPYLGIYTSIIICLLVTFANSGGNLALEAAAGLFVVHLIDSNILFPRIVGGRVKMNPFITIIAVIVGEYLWGIPGMFLFIPMTGIIKLICERVEGLEAWSILIGVDDEEKAKKVKTLNLD